jgi:transcriptional regulator with XRE-family HTH domain
MADDAQTPLAGELRRLMEQAGIGQRRLAEMAGVNETYVRDVLKGKSKNPGSAGLAAVARALGCAPARLLSLAGGGEDVHDPRERLLLSVWRELSEQDQTEALHFIEFRLTRGRPSGETVIRKAD